MATELVVPNIGESITEVQIGRWLKSEGEYVAADDPVVELESDKATLELPAPAAGKISSTLKKTGDKANVGDVIGYIEEGAAGDQPDSPPDEVREPGPEGEPATEAQPEASAQPGSGTAGDDGGSDGDKPKIMPAAARMLAEHNVDPRQVEASGSGGRLLKEDVARFLERGQEERKADERPGTGAPPEQVTGDEEAVPMSPMRMTIARRLVEAQQTAALLTTFNEIDMSAVKALRAQHQQAFQERYEVKLGFMSFFVKASVDALKHFPAVNAEIRGEEIIYRNRYDIGIAIGGGKGLVVPILRHAERMSFAEIELAINDFAERARQNKIELSELSGGTFSISNGGVYGSLLSTPIVNPPQSGILGLHAIQDRPVARDGQVVIRPMMYVALTYDHRLVDGKDAVSFLHRIKDCIESPERMLMEV